MSFLSKMNKPKPVGVKPAAPIKKPAPLNKPAMKKPIAPIGVKPNPLSTKKLEAKEVIEEVKIDNEEIIPLDNMIEEGNEIELTVESVEETPKAVIEVEKEEAKEQIIEEQKEKTIEEVTEVVENEKEEKHVSQEEIDLVESVKELEEAKEEIKEEKMSPQKKGAITRKKNQENKKRKQALKEHKESIEEEIIEIKEIVSLPKVEINNVEEYMMSVVLPSVETWEEEKQEVREVVDSIEIDPDMNSATAKVVLSDLALAYSTLTSRLTHYKTQYENLTGKDGIIECVKAIYGQGKNAEERKFAATQACMNYVKEGETEAVNLFEYEYMVRNRYYFYEGVVKELEFKRQLLITFNGMLNLESRL